MRQSLALSDLNVLEIEFEKSLNSLVVILNVRGVLNFSIFGSITVTSVRDE